MHILLGRGVDLGAWEARPVAPGVLAGPGPGDRRDRFARVVAREPPGPPLEDGPYRRLARALQGYDVFPPRLGRRVLRRIPVQDGDTVALLYRLLPGVRVLFASRVAVTFDGPGGRGWRAGFAYRTLVGHPEEGEEEFAVEKDAESGEITASLSSWSRPGHLLVRLFPGWARREQVAANHGALDHLQALAEGATPTPLLLVQG